VWEQQDWQRGTQAVIVAGSAIAAGAHTVVKELNMKKSNNAKPGSPTSSSQEAKDDSTDDDEEEEVTNGEKRKKMQNSSAKNDYLNTVDCGKEKDNIIKQSKVGNESPMSNNEKLKNSSVHPEVEGKNSMCSKKRELDSLENKWSAVELTEDVTITKSIMKNRK